MFVVDNNNNNNNNNYEAQHDIFYSLFKQQVKSLILQRGKITKVARKTINHMNMRRIEYDKIDLEP